MGDKSIATAQSSDVLSRRAAYMLLAFLVLIWGLNWPVMKLAMQIMPPLWFVVIRLTLGAGCILALLMATGRVTRPDRRDLPIILTVAVFQMTVYMGLIAVGLKILPAGRSAILAYTTPLWVVPAAVFFFGERFNLMKLIGMTLGLGGIVVLFNPTEVNWSDSSEVLGNVVLLLSSASWAIAILHARRHRWHLTPLQLAPYQMTIALPALALVAWLFEGPPIFVWSGELFWILLYNGPLATAFAFWAALSLQRALPSSTASLSYLAVPVCGLVASTLWLNEELTAGLIAGAIMIIGGVAAMAMSDRAKS